ncbi:MAG: hypothetical protein NT023_04555 [Armatimonadetes bacterium]|nr:hypothetical protein [Armatimonadota bacterium]
MKDRFFVFTFLFFLSGTLSFAGSFAAYPRYVFIPYPKTPPNRVPAPVDPSKNPLVHAGERLKNLPIKHWNGETVVLDWKQNQILLFVSGCGACSKPTLEEAERIAQRLPAKSIVVVVIGTVAVAKPVAPQFPHLEMRVDEGTQVANRLGIRYLPQVFLVGTGGVVEYVQPDNQDWLTALRYTATRISKRSVNPTP